MPACCELWTCLPEVTSGVGVLCGLEGTISLPYQHGRVLPPLPGPHPGHASFVGASLFFHTLVGASEGPPQCYHTLSTKSLLFLSATSFVWGWMPSSGHPVGTGYSGNTEGPSDEYLLWLRWMFSKEGWGFYICLGRSKEKHWPPVC